MSLYLLGLPFRTYLLLVSLMITLGSLIPTLHLYDKGAQIHDGSRGWTVTRVSLMPASFLSGTTHGTECSTGLS